MAKDPAETTETAAEGAAGTESGSEAWRNSPPIPAPNPEAGRKGLMPTAKPKSSDAATGKLDTGATSAVAPESDAPPSPAESTSADTKQAAAEQS